MPVETLKKIETYVQNGGTVLALDKLPEFSTGYIRSATDDQEVKRIIQKLFGDLSGRSIDAMQYGNGNAHYLKSVIHREIWWDQYSAMLDPFLKILNKTIPPDFEIDFTFEELRKNKGLTFLHRKIGNTDLYFVTNIQDTPVSLPVNFRVQNKNVWNWNPYNGDINQLFHYSKSASGTKIPVKLAPWESTIIVFEEGIEIPHVSKTNMSKIVAVSEKVIVTEVSNNGSYFMNIVHDSQESFMTHEVFDLPSPMVINGNWELTLESDYFPKVTKELKYLSSWTENEETKHFSGTAKYSIDFEIPDEYINPDLKLEIDLGKLGNVAEVLVNGKKAGTVWMKGQKCEISHLLKKGRNKLIVLVTNTNINRVSGFTDIVPVPDALQEKYGKAKTGSSLPREFGFEPLPPSGLMGPVKINPIKTVKMSY